MNNKRSFLIAMLGLLLTAGAGSALAQNPNCPRANCPNAGQNCPNQQCPRTNAGKRGPAMNRGARRGARMAANCPRMAGASGNNSAVPPSQEKKQ